MTVASNYATATLVFSALLENCSASFSKLIALCTRDFFPEFEQVADTS